MPQSGSQKGHSGSTWMNWTVQKMKFMFRNSQKNVIIQIFISEVPFCLFTPPNVGGSGILKNVFLRMSDQYPDKVSLRVTQSTTCFSIKCPYDCTTRSNAGSQLIIQKASILDKTKHQLRNVLRLLSIQAVDERRYPACRYTKP